MQTGRDTPPGTAARPRHQSRSKDAGHLVQCASSEPWATTEDVPDFRLTNNGLGINLRILKCMQADFKLVLFDVRDGAGLRFQGQWGNQWQVLGRRNVLGALTWVYWGVRTRFSASHVPVDWYSGYGHYLKKEKTKTPRDNCWKLDHKAVPSIPPRSAGRITAESRASFFFSQRHSSFQIQNRNG